MNLFQKMKSRKNDMKTLSTLLESSIARSVDGGEPSAGAHHLVTSAFEMDDDTAIQALAALGKSPADFAESLESLEHDTLAGLGIEAPELPSTPGASNEVGVLEIDIPERWHIPKARLGKTDATFEAALKAIYEIHNEASDYRRLQSAHVLAGVAAVEYGIAARVFTAMGLERSAISDACRTKLGPAST